MNRDRLITASRRIASSSSALALGVPLALLWGLHAAANYVPGTGYLRLPLVFVMAGVCVVWRLSTGKDRPRNTSNSVVTTGLCCSFIAATLSTILNWDTSEVVQTYVFVFLSGGAVFVALSGIACTPAALDVAVAGLALGALFPLVGGLLAFNGEWGSPDMTTTISAWHDIARMDSYTAATFGNRGNTAGFLLLVTPMLFAVLVDHRKRAALRALCGATLIPVVLNLIVLQVRAAYIALFVALVLVWTFELGVRRLPLMIGILVLGWILLVTFEPDVGVTMTERILPAITVDTEADDSVQGRVDAIEEGFDIARRNWLLGIGPGGAQTVHSQQAAHQFQLQQGMETGILGLLGSILFSIGVVVSLFRTMTRRRGDHVNDTRFLLLIGPAAYISYASIANAALTNGSVNTWTVLLASMLALAPQFGPEVAGRRSRSTQWSLPQLAGTAGGRGQVGTLSPVAGRSGRWRG